MQTLQNHKIDSVSIVRHSENCKENLTAKPRNDGNRMNSWLSHLASLSGTALASRWPCSKGSMGRRSQSQSRRSL